MVVCMRECMWSALLKEADAGQVQESGLEVKVVVSECVLWKESRPWGTGHSGCMRLQLHRDRVTGCGGNGDSDGGGGRGRMGCGLSDWCECGSRMREWERRGGRCQASPQTTSPLRDSQFHQVSWHASLFLRLSRWQQNHTLQLHHTHLHCTKLLCIWTHKSFPLKTASLLYCT